MVIWDMSQALCIYKYIYGLRILKKKASLSKVLKRGRGKDKEEKLPAEELEHINRGLCSALRRPDAGNN